MFARVQLQSASKIERYFPFVFVYFFVNATGLPMGLLYTTALAPLFYLWLWLQGRRWILARFGLVFSPWIVMHLLHKAQIRTYAVSLAVMMAICVCAYAFYVFVNWTRRLTEILDRVIAINFALACVGIALYFTPWEEFMWKKGDMFTSGVKLSRFQMFTYEPSYYSTLLAPLVIYAFFRWAGKDSPRNFCLLAMTLIPLLMAYSFGVISALLLALGLVHVLYVRRLMKRPYMLVAIPVAAVALLYIGTGSTFITRLQNFLTGQDSSGMVRTVLSYYLSYQIALEKSLYWGVGFGQIKVVGADLISQFWENGGRLPCAIAETMAQFGLFGLMIRIAVEFYFAIKTKVHRNYFRFTLFVFIFVYQFTGSFLTNIAEYVIWILAFSQIFPEFEVAPAEAKLSPAPWNPQPLPQPAMRTNLESGAAR